MKCQSLDIFNDPTIWLAVPSGQAELKLSSKSGALRLDFDFKGGRGFVIARCEVSREMPSEYLLRFKVRGRGPINHFEIKLADASGKNVWRHERKDFPLPARWREVGVASHEIEYAWGPAGGGEIKQIGAIEFAIVAGEGGAGSVWLSDLRIEDHTLTSAPALSYSSARGEPTSTLESAADWLPESTDSHPWLDIDLHEARWVGGLIIEWADHAPSGGFRVSGSTTGKRLKTLHDAVHAGGCRSYVYLPKTKARHLRLALSESVGVLAVRWQGFEFSRSIDAFWHHIAADEPRGWHPRWLMREQSLWTPIGIPNGKTCALINEEGMIEISEGSFSVEPFVWSDGCLVTWADVNLRQELRDGWRPIPSVIWETKDWLLQIEALPLSDGVFRVAYRIKNLTGQSQSMRLFVSLRPFQVTPPWQHYRSVGGVSQICDLAWRDGVVRVNDSTTIIPQGGAATYGAMTFAEGALAGQLAGGELPRASELQDAFGFASGVLAFDIKLSAREEKEVGWCNSRDPSCADPWHQKLPERQLRGASWAEDAIHAMLTATAHILITRSGPALQPGPRRYTRSWIRDGTIMSAALLRMGCADDVREFIRWYAPHQREDGFIPCCVDRDGADPLVEHDSHGQFIALIADYMRFTGDTALLDEMWPRILKGVAFLEATIEPGGLLPISASHEGYLAQPVHSYWDDFWALRGLRDAITIAGALGHHAEAMRWRSVDDGLSAALAASIEATRKARHLDSIPGSQEWADFDPTATANAITLLDVPSEMNRAAIDWTFDKYLSDWRKKRTGELEWSNYTPYEIRIIGALVRLGRRDDALELLRFFLSDRRPLAWNQWPEIAWRDPRSPGHIGDVPHTWISAEYVLAVQSLFAYESETQDAIVIAAGLAPEWLDGDGVRVTDLPVSCGALTYSLRSFPDGPIVCEISAGITLPTGGILLRPPLRQPVWRVTINDVVVDAHGVDEIRILELPVTIVIHPNGHA